MDRFAKPVLLLASLLFRTLSLKVVCAFWAGVMAFGVAIPSAFAEGLVSKVTSAPIFANGIVKDIRSGTNVFLQRAEKPGDLFLDPKVIGYGIPAGGRMEVELMSGFQRDPAVPLDRKSILLVVGTPQQGLPAPYAGYNVREGDNDKTFVIEPNEGTALVAEKLISIAPGASLDPIPQRGIKIIHIGRSHAFVSRGDKGVIEVRIYDGSENIIHSGKGEVEFLPEPYPQVFPTNIPHDQRNHDWQRVGVGKILGVASNTLPLPVILYERNDGLGNKGTLGAGVLSLQQLVEMGYESPESLKKFTDGLIVKDTDGNGLLDPKVDTVIGGVSIETPQGATGYQLLTPLVSEKPFLSLSTSRYNERAGASIGGAIMQVVFIAGDVPGLYRPTFSLLKVPGAPERGVGSSMRYTVVVE